MSSPYFGNVQFISPLPAGYMETATSGANAIARGIESAGQSLGEGIKQYYKNKEETETARAGFEKAIALASQNQQAFNNVNPEQLKEYNKLIAGRGTASDYQRVTGQIVGQLTGFQQKQEQQIRQEQINKFAAENVSAKNFTSGLQDLYSGNIAKPNYVVDAPVKPAVAGNIDLNARPIVQNKDGTISTVQSLGVNIDGKEVLIPQVSADGTILTQQEAIDNFKKTGQHLGIFNSVDESNAYAQALHNQQGQDYIDKTQNPTKWAMSKLMQNRPMSPEDSAKLAGAVANYYQKTPEQLGMTPSGATSKGGETIVSYETNQAPKVVPVEGTQGLYQEMVGGKPHGLPFPAPTKNASVYDSLPESKQKVADKFFADLQNDPVYKAHGVAESSMKQMENLGIGTSKYRPSDDISLIFSFMKTLDPNSTVREGEYANAQNTAGIPEKIINQYNKAIDGQFLNDSQRNDFLSTARKNYVAQVSSLKDKVNMYRNQAESRGIPADLIDDGSVFKYAKQVEAKMLPRFQSEADAISSGTERALVLDPKTGTYREWVK